MSDKKGGEAAKAAKPKKEGQARNLSFFFGASVLTAFLEEIQ